MSVEKANALGLKGSFWDAEATVVRRGVLGGSVGEQLR